MKKRLLILGLWSLLAAAFAFIAGLHPAASPLWKAKQTIAEGTKLEPLSEVQSKAIEKALGEIDRTFEREKETLDRSRMAAIVGLLAIAVACLSLRHSLGGNDKKPQPNQAPHPTTL